jgi:hypothetical protein
MTIYDRTVGTESILNTCHPVRLIVERWDGGGTRRPVWTVARVCNGVGDPVGTYATRKAAIARADSI